MIAITFALPAESCELQRRLTEKKIARRGGQKVTTGRIGGREVQIVHTGVGEKVARARLTQYLDTVLPALLISSGFAGGVRSNLRVGDLLLAENFSDPAVIRIARRVLREQTAHTAKLWSVPRMIDAPEEREEIWRKHEAIAVDMETETIAALCGRRGLRLLSLRVLSDTPQQPFPLPAAVLFDMERQKTPALRLMVSLLAHPAAIPRLIRFRGQIGRARRSLTTALTAVLRSELHL